MTDRLKKAQALLTEFEQQLAEKRRVYDGFHLPGDYQNKQRDDFLTKEIAYSWIYAATDHHLIEAVEPPIKEVPKAFLKKAITFYNAWLSKGSDIQLFPEYIIPCPTEEESLNTYLQKLWNEIMINHERRTIWFKSLRRFTHFLRSQESGILFDQQGWLKILFPDKMGLILEKTDEGDISPTAIVRKVPLTGHAIDISTAAAILEGLADEVLNGRLDTRLTAAETLAFCWVCLTSSRLRFPTELNMLYESNMLGQEQNLVNTDAIFGSKYYLELQTYLGDIPVEISLLQYEYLNVLYTSDRRLSFFKSDLRSLRRLFDRVVAKADISDSLGKITFLSFTSPPHLAIGRRSQKIPVASL